MNFVFNYGQLLNTAETVCDERYHIRPLPGMDLLRTKTVHSSLRGISERRMYGARQAQVRP